MMKKALLWAYGDSVRYIAFMLGVAAFVTFLQVLIVFPWQTITTILIGFAAYTLFTLASEWR
jgi:hypothetical protein